MKIWEPSVVLHRRTKTPSRVFLWFHIEKKAEHALTGTGINQLIEVWLNLHHKWFFSHIVHTNMYFVDRFGFTTSMECTK